MRRSSTPSRFYKPRALFLVIFILIFSGTQNCYALEITKPNVSGLYRTEVNTHTGNLFYERTDLYIPGRGLSIDLTFSYNSGRTQQNRGFGYGWSFNYGMQYSIEGTSIIIERGDGDKEEYTWNGSSYDPPVGVYDELIEYQPDQYLLISKYGIKYYFDDPAHKKLTSTEDRNNNTLSFNYYGSELITITDPDGRQVEIEYNPDGTISSITDPNASPARIFTYDYDVWGNMVKVTDPMGNATNYEYGMWHNMIGITNANGNSVTIFYNENQAVQYIECPAVNAKKTLEYDTINHVTTVTDTIISGNQVINYSYDLNGRVIQIQHPDGNSIFYTWDGQNNITEFIDPNGHIYTYTYDAKGNRLSVSDPLGYIESFTYDPVYNFVLSNTDKNGNIYNYSYDGTGNLLNETDPLGNIISYTYDLYGNIITQTDANGNTTTYSYNSNGDLITITDATGYMSTYSYDPVGNRISETDANGYTTSYEYDPLNRLVVITDALGYISTYSYDPVGNRISETDANSNITTYEYDPLNRLIVITDALAHTTSYSYDPVGNRISETDANSNITTYEYDPLNRLIVITDALGNTTSYSYDPVGNRISETDANGNITTYSYDPLNRLIGKTDALGYISTYSYDPVGNLISETDANGNTSTYSYDPLNRLIDITDALGNISTYSYDPVGNRISETDANSNTTSYSYDPLNRLINITDALGYISTYSYDPVGNRISETDANSNTTTYSYDPLNRLIDITDALGYISTYSYDPVGNRISETDANGNTTLYSYSCCRLISTTDPLGFSELYSYDPVGNRISVTDANGNTNTYTYDALNRMIELTSPMGNQTTFDYDGVGNTITRTDGNGSITNYSYDALNRLITITYPVGSIGISYDAVGNILQLQNIGIGLGDITDRIYDALDRSISETINYGAFSKTVSYSYDPVGNLTGLTDPDGLTIIYDYNVVNHLESIIDQYGGISTKTYDPAGNCTEIIFPDGQRTTTTYDNSDRITNKTTYDPFNTVIFTYDYTYDQTGKVLNVDKNGSFEAQYLYNPANRLTDPSYVTGQNIQYTYDPVWNRLTQDNNGDVTSYVHNLEDRVVSQTLPDLSIINYLYDNNSNVVQTSSSWGIVNYGYDYENRLNVITYPYPYGTIINYFSPEGKRLARDEQGQITYYFPSLMGVVGEMDALGNTLARINPGVSIARDFIKDEMTEETVLSYSHWDGEQSTTNFTGSLGHVSFIFDYFGGMLDSFGYIEDVDPGLYTHGMKVDWNYYFGAELIDIDYAPDIDQHFGGDFFYDDEETEILFSVMSPQAEMVESWMVLDGGGKVKKCKCCGVKKFVVKYSKPSGWYVGQLLRIDVELEFMSDDTHDPACCEFKQNVKTAWKVTAGPHKGQNGGTGGKWQDDNYGRGDDTDGKPGKSDPGFTTNDNPGLEGLHANDVIDYSFSAEQMVIEVCEAPCPKGKTVAKKGPHTVTVKGKEPRTFTGVPKTL